MLRARKVRFTRRSRHLLLGFLSALVVAGVAPAAHAARALSATDWAGSRPFDASSPAGIAYESATLQWIQASSSRPRTITSGADGEWQRVAPPRGLRRLQPSLIYDSARNRIIAFGGTDAQNHYTNTLRVLQVSGGTWATLAAAGTPPPARRLHRAVYDPSGDRMIVYGGWNDALLGDVWQLSLGGTPTWTELSPTGDGPGPRAGCGVVYDVASNRMVVFGGFDGVSDPADRASDVWALSLSGPPAWTELAAAGAGPSGRSSMSAAYDPSGPAMIVFGGTDPEYLDETWRFALDGSATWTPLATTGTAPEAREEHVGQIDPATRRMFVYGGYNEYEVLGDSYRLDLTTDPPAWSSASPQPEIFPRWGAGSTVAAAGKLYVHGGRSWYGATLGDFWWTSIANPVSWNTTILNLPPRLQAAMVLDTNRDRLVVFGGTNGAYQNDTYTHSMVQGLGWEPFLALGTPPSPRRLHTGVFDPVGDRLIVFGGYDDQLLGDLWQLSFAGTPTWSPIEAEGGGPSPRGGHVAIYDPETKRMIVYGGYDGVTPPGNRVSDVWALSLDGTPTWTQLDPGPGPTARSSASAVYDAARHAMVLFGGTTPTFQDEAWRLSLDDPPSWTLLAGGGSKPVAREEQAAAYDTKRDRMLTFGGYDQWISTLADLASLDLASEDWSVPSPIGPPPSARWGAKAIADPTRDGLWLYGGWNGGYLNDLWFLQWHDDPSVVAMPTVTAEANPGVAHLVWSVPAGTPQAARIERSSNGSTWSVVGSALPNASSHIAFDDATAAPGQTLAWRATIQAEGRTIHSSPAWLTMPGTTGVDPVEPALAIRPAGRNRATGALAVWCSLPRVGPARVDLLDVAGRRLDSVALTAGTGAAHRVELGSDLPAGVYFARLTFGRETVLARLAFLR